MTKKELIKALEEWPDDAKIELSIAHDVEAENPLLEDKVWLEIAAVERIDKRNLCNLDNNHCLISGGKIERGARIEEKREE